MLYTPELSSTNTTNSPTLYIIYNASSTLLGKLNYVYRKQTCPDPSTNPACAACELTHGPSLSLRESSEWKTTKAHIKQANIAQVHTDERPASLAQWMDRERVSAPAVVVETQPSDFRMLVSSEELAQVSHDHREFLTLLRARVGEMGFAGVVVE